ncbi:M24 family metallopeptidase [Blastococcus sp. PRF04-17]|uniref:M24 family metallopeptidase n=1 Tax=Blastococcus sp. PRF04-17 TaxID=2933797 RepID=UPI001FF2D712|nr:Xaa-Pro peptidase family protein [Blastococcus sp. PRF04-17]UOY02873.1 Xaa-Pro peptidase family protein [Blastococcus sp. PRF04-17]
MTALTGVPVTRPTALADARLARLRAVMADADADWLVVSGVADVLYASGYRSVSDAVIGRGGLVALVGQDDLWLCGPAADGPAAVAGGLPADRYVGWGRFFFDEPEGPTPGWAHAERYAGLSEAVADALQRSGARGRILAEADLGELAAATLPTASVSGGARRVTGAARSAKLPGEVELLRRSAELAEAGIQAALSELRAGVTERELGARVAATMAAGGGEPRFVVVATGERSALADAPLTGRRVEAGDIVRFDVGCVLDGYWSDVGRTAVLGEPDATLARRYAAVLDGEEQQLRNIAPGLGGAELFEIAVAAVEAGGITPYRRHHCGHGIGLDIYETPGVGPASRDVLREGMTVNVETPYYELGWGGIMVEDTVVVTTEGCEWLTASPRDLRVVEP